MLSPEILSEIDPNLNANGKFTLVAHIIAAGGELPFLDLLKRCPFNKSTLSLHADDLEKEGYIAVKRSFVGKRARATLEIRPKGRDGFARHCAAFQKIAEAVNARAAE